MAGKGVEGGDDDGVGDMILVLHHSPLRRRRRARGWERAEGENEGEGEGIGMKARWSFRFATDDSRSVSPRKLFTSPLPRER